MNVFLLNDGRATSNWGLQASTQALLDLFKEKKLNVSTLTHSNLHSKYSWDFKIMDKKLFNENSRFLSRFSPLNLNIPETADQYDFYTDLWKQGNGGILSAQIIQKIDVADIVIFNAEGSTYRKNFGSLAGLFILYYAAKIHKKRALFANGSFTISSVDNVLSGIAKKLYSEGVDFFVREPISSECLSSVGVDAKVVPDSVFYYADKSSSDFGITDKFHSFAVSKSMLPMCNFTDVNNDPFYLLINQITKKTGMNPVFFARDPEDQMIRKYLKHIPNAKAGIFNSNNFKEVQTTISESKILLSGRYHHLIFALNSGTDVCPFSSSSHKNEGLMKLISHPSLPPLQCFDPTDIRANIGLIVENIENQLYKKTNDSYVSSKLLRQQFIDSYTDLLQ